MIALDSGWKDFQVVRLSPGRTPDEALQWLAHPAPGGSARTPAGASIGGTAGTPPGRPAVLHLNLTSGGYLLVLQTYDSNGAESTVLREVAVR